MREALYDTVSAELDAASRHGFRATGSVLREPGYLALYQEARDDDAADDESTKALPPLAVGDKLPLLAVQDERHTTEPPPRYTEASLVKALEERGIGRPSTYASIIATLKDRDYVTLKDKRFVPTDTGVVVAGFLGKHFERYVDYDFTARMEDQLDAIARGEAPWVQVLERFWKNFKHQVDDINEHVSRKDATTEALEEPCPKCGKPLLVRFGKRGRFIGCSAYPECDYTRNADGSVQEEQDNKPIEGRSCPQCGAPLLQRVGRYGPFIGCSAYPKCRFVEKLAKEAEDSGVPCPSCHKGTLVRKRSRQGRSFFSCSTYPTCKYALSHQPLAEPCPKCGGPILMLRTTKRHGTEKVCPNKECGFAQSVQEGPSGPDSDQAQAVSWS
jgi:DNA topoisomerase-1